MRNILEIYQGVLRELDKYNSPSFETEDFNYFYNKARLERCNLRYQAFDTKQQLSDDLRQLVKHRIYSVTEMTDNREVLPLDYFHLLGVTVTFRYKNDVGCHKKDDKFRKACKRLTADNYGFIMNRKYFEPKSSRPYFKQEGNELLIDFGVDDNIEIFEANLEYLTYPKQIKLNPDFSSTPINDTSEFSDYIDNEDIKICVSLFLENVEQRRQQTYAGVAKTVT